jgi:hypothetical protein
VLALDAAGVGRADATRATAWLAQPDVLRGYIGNGTTESFVFAHALAAEAQGRNPTRFGGVNLLGEIRAQLAGSGQFLDRSANSDLLRDDVDSQAMAIIALHCQVRRRLPGEHPVCGRWVRLGSATASRFRLCE